MTDLLPEKKHLHQNNDQRYQKHKYRYPVYPMHVPHPLRMRRVWVALFDIEIFRQLSQEAHDIDV